MFCYLSWYLRVIQSNHIYYIVLIGTILNGNKKKERIVYTQILYTLHNEMFTLYRGLFFPYSRKLQGINYFFTLENTLNLYSFPGRSIIICRTG